MLSVQENERLTQVGPGTPMGELMRRYWHPIAAAAELSPSPEGRPTRAVRLLGEDLVLYRDRSGTLGLIDLLCAHRRVDLSYGIPEEHGLRCMYHGWLYDETGQCIEQPFEETVHPPRMSSPAGEGSSEVAVKGGFKDKVRIAGYPVQELGGLIFAYLGPLPAPLLPRWEQLTWDNAVRDIALSNLECNWLQCQENSLDAVHTEWLHNYFGNYVRTGIGFRPASQGKTTRIAFEQFEMGIMKRRLQEGFPEDGEDWAHGHPVLFPNILFVGDQTRTTTQWRVPIDDEHTFHVSYYAYRAAPGHPAPVQNVVPYRWTPLRQEDGRYVVDVTFNQDYMAWQTQGPIADRNREVLGQSDVGIILFRKQLSQQMAVIADGGDPMNVWRGPFTNELIELPIERVKHGNVPDGRYYAGEAGDTTAEPLIREVLLTWVDREHMPEAVPRLL
jgi:5,5'-dehydrodivanillate O-demethylase